MSPSPPSQSQACVGESARLPTRPAVAPSPNSVEAFIKDNTEVLDADLPSPDDCPICMNEYSHEPPVRVKVAQCGHIFGMTCLKGWLSRSVPRDKKCPICQTMWMASSRPSLIDELVAPLATFAQALLSAEHDATSDQAIEASILQLQRDLARAPATHPAQNNSRIPLRGLHVPVYNNNQDGNEITHECAEQQQRLRDANLNMRRLAAMASSANAANLSTVTQNQSGRTPSAISSASSGAARPSYPTRSERILPILRYPSCFPDASILTPSISTNPSTTQAASLAIPRPKSATRVRETAAVAKALKNAEKHLDQRDKKLNERAKQLHELERVLDERAKQLHDDMCLFERRIARAEARAGRCSMDMET